MTSNFSTNKLVYKIYIKLHNKWDAINLIGRK